MSYSHVPKSFPMAKFTSKRAIRDSFDEEEASDDVDDEVFIRDGRNGYKMDKESGVKKPLMPLRRQKRLKTSMFASSATHEPRSRFKIFLAPCCYGVAALSILLGLMAFSVIIINYFSLPLSRIQLWFGKNKPPSGENILPCTMFSLTNVWYHSFPKLTSETAIRLNDVNHDGILDIILGYGTGTDGRNVPDFVCTLYFGRDPPCLGGVVALNGKNGEIVWQHWTRRPVFSIDCTVDITKDGVNDCLVGGKGGLLHVINGHDGSLLWHLEDQLGHQKAEVVLDVYSAQYIADIDGDGVVDVIASHTVSDLSGNSVKGHLLVISGKFGHMLRMVEMPGGSESYYSPQLLVHPDGETVILIGTGGTASHSWGGLHAVPLRQLAGTDKVPFQTLITSDSRGLMSPPVLVDINHDGTEDIVISLFNSTVVALDGKTYKTLWNYTFTNSQTFSSPTPGFFNDDDVPDFLVKYQNGPDFPVYFYSEMNILDGKTGQPLLDHPVVDSVGSQMGGLSISVEGPGNDWFLYWTVNCAGHEGSQTPFSFAKGSDIVAQSQADVCRLRFNSSMVATQFAINRHVDAPGFLIYSSDKQESIEYNNSKESLHEARQYLASHPDFWSTYGAQEDGIKSSSGDAFQSEDPNQPADGQISSFGSTSFKGDQPKGILSNVARNSARKGGEIEEPQDPDYAHMQTHQVGKHHKPYISSSVPRDWHIGEASKNFGTLYDPRPRTSDNLDQDYEGAALNGDTPSSQFSNVFNSYLADGRSENEQERVEQAPPDFANIFHNQRKSGNRRIRSSMGVLDNARKSYEFSRLERETDSRPEDSKGGQDVNDSNIPKGIYPITSTGTLAPPISGSGIDLVLASYWIPPSDGVQILTQRDIECMKQGIAKASNDDSEKYANMDQESVELAVTAECLFQRFSKTSSLDSSPTSDSNLETHPGFIPKAASGSQSTYKALNLRLGQLTVYRLNLQCKCSPSSNQGSCAKILPFNDQRWPSFMGRDGRGYFHPQ